MSVLPQPSHIITADDYLRRERLAPFRRLVEYVLVRQDRMEVEVFSRHATQEWSSILYNEATDEVLLKSVDCSLTLAEIYGKVVPSQVPP